MTADRDDRDALERMLAASLRDRSQDVEPTPALWHRVETKVNRTKKFSIAAWTAGVAVAALVGVTVIPNLLPAADGEITVQPDPTPDAPAPATGMPSTIVASDGERFWLADAATGAELRELFALNPEGEGTVRTFAVHPASTADDVTVVWVNSAEGMLDLKWFQVRDDLPADAPEEARVGFGDVAYLGVDRGGEAPLPRFSEDGAHLAWFGQLGGHGGADPDAGPGINVGEWLHEESTSPINRAVGRELVADHLLRVEAFEGGAITLMGEDLRTHRVEFRGYEANTPLSAAEEVDGGETGALIDIAEVSAEAGYVLQARGEGQGDTVFTLSRATADGPASTVLEEVHATNAPGDAWIEAVGDGVLFQRLGAVLVVDATSGEAFELPRDIVYAAWLPGGAAEPAPTPQPSATPTASGLLPDLVVVDAVTGDVTVEVGGEVVHTLYEGRSAEFRPAGVAVFPSSTADELSAVAWLAGEGVSEFWQLGVSDGQVQGPVPFPDAYQPSAGIDGRSMRAPLFLALGTKLAWVEYGPSGTCTLRVIGWGGGPGTGRPADDNASFTLEGCADGATLEDAQLGDFDEQGRATGVLSFEVDLADDPDGIREPVNYLILEYEIQGDGAFALPRGNVLSGEPGHGAWVLALNGGIGIHNVSTQDGRRIALYDRSAEPATVPSSFRLVDAGFLAWLQSANGAAGAVFGDGAGNAWVYVARTRTFTQVGFAGPTGQQRAVAHADVLD